ncbi:MAG: hypothetical protein FWC24_01665 [Treponema sp.]|nr:hypothetical protein [Treponema sp.]
MNPAAWNLFTKARKHYRSEIRQLIHRLPQLQSVQQKLINNRSPSYTVETPIVYNSALDDITADSEIRLILVADNPGRREQATENRRYLVGPSGKIAEKFFRDNPALHINFRANAIILNKTPIHTPRTVELRDLCREYARIGGDTLETALAESQLAMARLLLEFHRALLADENDTLPVWITGYSEMKKGGVFEAYTNELKALYAGTGLADRVFLYRHFSMNQFTIDLNRQAIGGESLDSSLKRIGAAYRKKYLF